MLTPITYRILADIVLVTHAAVVVFVVGGLVLVIVGNVRHWRWVNSLMFRLAHLAAVAVVVVQAWLGHLCPLTVLESWLREQAGDAPYAAGFVEHWVQRILFYAAPFWVFVVVYTLFGLLVAATWWYFPPARTGGRGRAQGD